MHHRPKHDPNNTPGNGRNDSALRNSPTTPTRLLHHWHWPNMTQTTHPATAATILRNLLKARDVLHHRPNTTQTTHLRNLPTTPTSRAAAPSAKHDTNNTPATTATILRRNLPMTPTNHAAAPSAKHDTNTNNIHSRQRPQRLCGMFPRFCPCQTKKSA